MKRFASLLVALALLVGYDAWPTRRHFVVHAQSLPYTMQVTFPPNPATDNVTAYLLSVDGGAVSTVLPTACTPQCVGTVPVLTTGAHTLSNIAQNQLLSSTVPVTVVLQNSLPQLTAFTVNLAPGRPGATSNLR